MDRFLLAIPLAILLAGCSSQSPAVVDVTVEDDYLEVLGQQGTRNGQATAGVGADLEFLTDGLGRHHLRIHHEADPASTFLLDTASDEEIIIFNLQREGTYHVWCSIHGAMGSGMHLDVHVD